MATVSMNLRTPSTSKLRSKMKRQPQAQQLPQIPTSMTQDFPGDARTRLLGPIYDALDAEQQIIAIRKAFQDIQGKTEAGRKLASIFCQWFFILPAHSSIRKVISSCFNKLSETGSENDDLVEIFSLELESRMTKCDFHSVSCVNRCFETCWVARNAALAKIEFLAKTLVSLLTKLLHLDDLDHSSLICDSTRALMTLSMKCDESQNFPDCQTVLFGVLDQQFMPIETKVNAAVCLLQLDLNRINKTQILKQIRNVIESQYPNGDNYWMTRFRNDIVIQLCFCQATLVLLPEENLTPDLMKSVRDLTLSVQPRSSKSSFELHQARLMLLWIQKFEILIRNDHISSNRSEFLLPSLEDYIFCQIRSSQDNVRHVIRNILGKMIKLLQDLNPSEYLNLLKRVMSLSWAGKEKFIALLTVVKHVGCRDIMALEPNLPTMVLSQMGDKTVSSFCSELYELSLTMTHSDLSLRDQWVAPLFKHSEFTQDIQRILKHVFKTWPDMVDKILEDTNDDDTSLNHFLLAVQIKKLKVNFWKDYVVASKFQSAASHFNDRIRLNALGCICVSKSSVEPFSPDELKFVTQLCQENLIIETQAEKQIFLDLLKKFLLRLNESYFSGKKGSELEKQTFEDLNNFLTGLQVMWIENLTPYANIHRRTATLNCLKLLADTFPNMFSYLSCSQGQILFNLLEDTYETNKDIALFLLEKWKGAEILGFDDVTKASNLWNECLRCCDSISPIHSANASYYLLFLLRTKGLKAKFKCHERSDLITSVLQEYLERLEVQLREECSASEKPIYGLVLCMRKVLRSCDSGDIQTLNLSNWCCTLLRECKKLHGITSIILQSSAPERTTFVLDEDDDGSVMTESQAKLLSAWRCCKEVSLLFADLVQVAPVTGGCFIDQSQVLEILDFFVQVLSSTIHRGAFEQAYIGFARICSVLWKTSLSNKVDTLLEDTLDAIGKKDYCLTRRGAGIPFLIQAIVIGDPTLNRSKVIRTLECLIQAASSEVGTIRVQAYNILRALFNNNKLGDEVASFTGLGIKIALFGFQSTNWAERNSATLLFSSLITRIFGVKRDKSDMSLKNTLTVRIFFQRFPELFPIFKQELAKAAKAIESNHGAICKEENSVFPILIILGKLIPSPSSTGLDNVQIVDLFESLYGCLGSSILRIRILSSKVMSRLYPSVETHSLHCSDLTLSSCNKIHGLLLWAQEHFKSNKEQLLHNKYLMSVASQSSKNLVLATEAFRILLQLRSHDLIPNENLIALEDQLCITLGNFGVLGKNSADVSAVPLRLQPGYEFCVQELASMFILMSFEGSKKKGIKEEHLEFFLAKANRDINIGLLRGLWILWNNEEQVTSYEKILEFFLMWENGYEEFMLLLKLCRKIPLGKLSGAIFTSLLDKVVYLSKKKIPLDAEVQLAYLYSHLLGPEMEQFLTMDKVFEWTLWLDGVSERSQDFGSESLRICFSEILLQNSRFLQKDFGVSSDGYKDDTKQELIHVILWHLVFSLSYDDIQEVRKVAHEIILRLSTNPSSIPPSTIHIELSRLCVKSYTSMKISVVVLCLELCLLNKSKGLLVTSDHQIFSRSEVNSWKEEDILRNDFKHVLCHIDPAVLTSLRPLELSESLLHYMKGILGSSTTIGNITELLEKASK